MPETTWPTGVANLRPVARREDLDIPACFAGPYTLAMEGTVEDVPVAELVQFFHLHGRDGRLSLRDEDGRPVATLYFHARQVRHALCRGIEGPEAAYAALSLSAGRFEFLLGSLASSIPRTITDSVQNLILEGLRRLEEMSHLTGLVPALDKPVFLAPEPPQDDIRLTAREWSVLSLVNGKRTVGEILVASGRPEAEVRGILAGLLAADLVVDRKSDEYLDAIVPEIIDERGGATTALRFAAQTLTGTVLLKRIDGLKTLRNLIDELRLDEGLLVEEIRLLIRTRWIRFAKGETEFRRWLAS